MFHKTYRGNRQDLQNIIPKDARKILDVGCASGDLGYALKVRVSGAGSIVEVVGIELNPSAAQCAGKKLDKVIIGDVEGLQIPYKADYFDCIIFGDILEHLRDPWAALKNLSRFLSADGCVVASIPNIQHYTIIKNLILGRWEYESGGLLDNTHLRFFTYKTIRKMFLDAGFRRINIHPNIHGRKYVKLIDSMGLNILTRFLVIQYFVVARKHC